MCAVLARGVRIENRKKKTGAHVKSLTRRARVTSLTLLELSFEALLWRSPYLGSSSFQLTADRGRVRGGGARAQPGGSAVRDGRRGKGRGAKLTSASARPPPVR